MLITRGSCGHYDGPTIIVDERETTEETTYELTDVEVTQTDD
jgi:hypothetical protein